MASVAVMTGRRPVETIQQDIENIKIERERLGELVAARGATVAVLDELDRLDERNRLLYRELERERLLAAADRRQQQLDTRRRRWEEFDGSAARLVTEVPPLAAEIDAAITNLGALVARWNGLTGALIPEVLDPAMHMQLDETRLFEVMSPRNRADIAELLEERLALAGALPHVVVSGLQRQVSTSVEASARVWTERLVANVRRHKPDLGNDDNGNRAA